MFANTDRREFKELLNFVTPEPERFSIWNRLLRSTAWMLRFAQQLKDRTVISTSLHELEVWEICRAEHLLHKRSQVESFAEELIKLHSKQDLPSLSRLKQLPCMLDSDGLIKISGRLNNSSLCESTKHPVILDSKNEITKLIINHYHQINRHQGHETVLNNLRNKYWILNGRNAVRKVAREYQHCKNRRVLPVIPVMGQLPSFRTERTVRPFIKVGVDFFGPIEVTVKRSHEKRYGVIFTCMVTRAVHLEIANSMSTNAFIHVLRQFGCRRGFPEEIYCDNGTNFKGAEKELSTALKEMDKEEIKRFSTTNNVKWNFNPPTAPHMGGAWERLIQSVKKVLKEMLTSRYPQEYVLRTLFAEIENIVNSRPMTHVSIDPYDESPLTPNHFLIGPQNIALPFSETNSGDLHQLSMWRASQKLADIFWKRWTEEYVPTLIRSTKWYQDRKGIKLGDVVLIVDSNGPRNLCQKGRVVKLFPGKDRKVRVVEVQTANSIYKRPVAKLCILDVQHEAEK